MPSGVPDVANRAGEQRPCFPPVCAIIVRDLAEGYTNGLISESGSRYRWPLSEQSGDLRGRRISASENRSRFWSADFGDHAGCRLGDIRPSPLGLFGFHHWCEKEWDRRTSDVT